MCPPPRLAEPSSGRGAGQGQLPGPLPSSGVKPGFFQSLLGDLDQRLRLFKPQVLTCKMSPKCLLTCSNYQELVDGADLEK